MIYSNWPKNESKPVTMKIEKIEQREWYRIISKFEDISLIQLWEYNQAKVNLGQGRAIQHLFWKKNEIIGAAQAIIRTIPFCKRGLVWINRAPLWRKIGEKENIALLKNMIKELQKYWVDRKKMYLRIVPPLLDNEENQIVLKEMGFSLCSPSFKWTSARVNLTRPEEDLRKGLNQKWRNNLNKAERFGLSFEFGNSSELISELIFDYKKQLQNNNFKASISPEFISILQNLLPDEKKMWVFAGRYNGEKLGGILIAPYGDVCEYIVGAVNCIGKKYNAGQFLLWCAICEMKKLGYRWFDVGGADPLRTPQGIFHFKEGLNGMPYRLIGEWEVANSFTQKLIKRLVEFRRK